MEHPFLLHYITNTFLARNISTSFHCSQHGNNPLFYVSIQNCIQRLLSFIVLNHFNQVPDIKYDLNTIICAIATGLEIGLSNFSLQTISISFYTMVKSGTPVFVLLFAFLTGLESPSWKLTAVIFIIVFGVLLMVLDDTTFSLTGYLEVQSATILAGLRWSLTQILLSNVNPGSSPGYGIS